MCVHTFLFTNTLRAQSDRPPWSNAEVWHERGRWPLGSYMTSIVGLWSSHALAIRTRGTHSPRTQMRGRGITCPEFIQHGRRAHQHSFNLPRRGGRKKGLTQTLPFNGPKALFYTSALSAHPSYRSALDPGPPGGRAAPADALETNFKPRNSG